MAAGCPTSCKGTYVKLIHGILHLLTVPCVVLGAVASMEYHRLKGLPHLYSLHSWMGILTVSLFVIQVNNCRYYLIIIFKSNLYIDLRLLCACDEHALRINVSASIAHTYELYVIKNIVNYFNSFFQFSLGFFTFVVLLCCRGATAACRLRCFAPIHATLGLCTFTLAIATCLTGLQQRADFTIFNNNGFVFQLWNITLDIIIVPNLYARYCRFPYSKNNARLLLFKTKLYPPEVFF